MNNDQKTVLLIHVQGVKHHLPGLPEALEKIGAVCRQLVLDGDYGPLLDALEGNVIPVVVKG
ncbi:MAG: hypothetical protein KUL88_07020 [Rhizobium sp.]|nr:hypothetical protein [Rhizobium sp.]